MIIDLLSIILYPYPLSYSCCYTSTLYRKPLPHTQGVEIVLTNCLMYGLQLNSFSNQLCYLKIVNLESDLDHLSIHKVSS